MSDMLDEQTLEQSKQKIAILQNNVSQVLIGQTMY